MVVRHQFALAAALGFLLSGCTSMGSSTPANLPVAAGPTIANDSLRAPVEPDAKRSNNTKAIDAVNALGSPVKSYEDENANQGSRSTSSKADAVTADGYGTGTCKNGFEFWVPDKAGDPNSTEAQYFYDSACTQLARDVVRKWSSGSAAGSETVNRTASNYAQGNSTPTAVRTSTANFSNGTFGKLGYPVLADGFALETSNQLNVGTSKSVLSDSEMIVAPASNGTASYCTDTAGYNSIGIPKLDKTFGWNGGALSGGTLTINSNGTTTWSATHSGSTESAPIGSFSIQTGTYNTACPISTPAYTLSGGTTRGSYTIPITITFLRGVPTSITVTNASLSNGDTLNVSTNGTEPPSSSSYFTGTVAKGTTTIATFNVNEFGNGTLTVASTGNQYVITDWNVVR